MSLTDAQVRAAKAQATPYKLAHGEGLFLHVMPNGSKVWRRNFSLGGKQRTDTFGAYPEIGLRKAAELAADSRRLVAKGIDPIALRRGESARLAIAAAENERRLRDQREQAKRDKEAAAAEKARDQATLARAARAYHERILPKFRNSKHGQQWINSLEHHVPAALWNKSLAEIRSGELVDVLVEVQRQVPETGRRVLQRLAAVFDDATLREQIDRDPMHGVGRRVRELVGNRSMGHHLALPYAEVPAVAGALVGIEGVGALALRFAILTAARTGEVLGMTWAEVDAELTRWTVPAARMKAGEPHLVALSPEAATVLNLMPRGRAGDLVFRSPKGGRLSNMAMLMILGRLGLRDRATVHGFRASFSTWANEVARARPDVVEACLAHKEGDRTRAAYNRAAFEVERRELLEAWGRFVCPAADPAESEPEAAVVVPGPR